MSESPDSPSTPPPVVVPEEELEAAARAICEGRSDDWTIPDDRINAELDARAALEAAYAAAYQPREGRYRQALERIAATDWQTSERNIARQALEPTDG